MSYIPSIENGAPAAGFNFPPDAEGGQGLLSAIALELLKTNETLTETALSLAVLVEMKALLSDIAVSVAAMAKK